MKSTAELKAAGGYQLTFKRNQIPYMQDYRFTQGIPAGVRFYVEDGNPGSWCKLVAGGYGTKDAYGNGAIYVSSKYVAGFH
jgi:hypothetical protein